MRPTHLLLWTLLATLAPAQLQAIKEVRPPGILFLFADDWRADCIGYEGNREVLTPHVDALAARGTRFTQAYCMGSHHGAVCAPSRAMLMTGRTLYRVRDDMKGTELLPERMRAAGFRTVATGKWHTGAGALRRGFERGRSMLMQGMSDHVKVPLRELPGGEGGLTPVRQGDGFSSEIFAEEAIRYLEIEAGREEERPFLVYCSFTSPHDPRQPPHRWREYYASMPPTLFGNWAPMHVFDIGGLMTRDEKLLPWPRTREDTREQLGEYYGMISHLDEQIGRILGTLARTGLDERTIVVFAADHGLSMGSHGLLGKQSVFEHSMRAPLVISGPGLPRGAVRDAKVYLHDLFPTLLDLVRLPVPEGLDGRSLRGVLADDDATVRDRIFLTWSKTQRAVREGDWKLIRYPQIDVTRLYHLGEDPGESVDLASLPQHAERVERLLAALREEQARAGDTMPLEVAEPKPAAIDLTGRKRNPDRWQPQWIREKYFSEQGR